jgi:hypothetical protein
MAAARTNRGIGGQPLGSHMIGMNRIIVIVIMALLMAILAAALWYAYGVWTALEGADMPVEIYLALVSGVIFSLVVGVGLMALLFYSSRHGYDDRACGGDLSDP